MAHGSELGGCLNCYAARQAVRHSGPGRPYEGLARMTSSGPRWTGVVRLVEEHLTDPLHWTRPRRVFVDSMGDLFHESVPVEWIDRIFAVMALAPQHQFQVLTKRPERMPTYFQLAPADAHTSLLARQALIGSHFIGLAPERGPTYEWSGLPLPNVQLGISAEDQPTFDLRWSFLRDTPAAVRWVSLEPLLGPIDATPALTAWCDECGGSGETRGHYSSPDNAGACHSCGGSGIDRYAQPPLDWVVVGGESGPDARPMHPDWARALRDQCVSAGVAFHFKQLGSVLAREWGCKSSKGGDPEEWPAEFRHQEYPEPEVAP